MSSDYNPDDMLVRNTGDKVDSIAEMKKAVADITSGEFQRDRARKTALEVMNMNRHERRRIGKQYGVKIPGIPIFKPKPTTDIVEPKE